MNGILLTAVSSGEVIVSVITLDGNKSADCLIKVISGFPVTDVSLNIVEKGLAINETFQLIATVNPANATNKSVLWETSAPDIATVDENGNVKAIKTGTANIIVTTVNGQKKQECRIVVNKNTVSNEQIDANEVTISVRNGGISLYIPKEMHVKIINMMGQIFYSHNLTQGEHTIHLDKGIYILVTGNKTYKIALFQ